ncbi:vacuolar-sorting protein SNF8 isoform X2 [Neocloeon triangulifer]|uniref:vacuolar-sorting protein SNF8 isoform X2 n=1 Tax=Neocloeon triangulifer TaxID=2078957 RepID=UPI00286F9824|nr:vacuolar-sorting protein SNF8 isoform X2 [Neocloeon triangulifer]
MRRRAGVGAIHKQKLEQEKYKGKGSEIQESQLEQLSKQMEVFRAKLEEFAGKHKNEIKKNAEFRRQFQEMCAAIGVDPLASSKGFWSVLGIGDFYYELSVQIIEVCLATNYKNGGLISMSELVQRLIRSRGRRAQEITVDDVLNAAKKLKILGNGFCILTIAPGQYLVQSVPGELTMDHTTVLQKASGSGKTSVEELCQTLKWDKERAERTLNYMLKEGLAWIDTQEGRSFWFPSLFAGCAQAA